MEDTLPAQTPRSSTLHSTLKWILTSGFAAAVLALWATLIGVLFRLGLLDAYGVPSELFLPESATELTYWSYVAALSVWAAWSQTIADQTWAMLWLGLMYGALVVAIATVIWWSHRHKERVNAHVARLKQGYWRCVLAFAAAVVLGTVALPWVTTTLSAFVIWLPLPGYMAGQAEARKNLKEYRERTIAGTQICHPLQHPSGPIGTCPYIMAQSRNHIAYLDGDRVHVIPADGVRFSKPLNLPVSKP